MGRKLLFLSIVASLVIGAAQGAFAHDHFGDWAETWTRYTSGTTTQAWEYGGGVGPTTYNPYGTSNMGLNGGVLTPGGYLVGDLGGSAGVHIYNNPIENPFKLMYIQVTTSKPLIGGFPVVIAPNHLVEKHAVFSYIEGGGFNTYTWKIAIYPNPDWEDVTLNFIANTIVEEIIIDTQCVPEPGAILAALSILGPAGLLFRRRKLI